MKRSCSASILMVYLPTMDEVTTLRHRGALKPEDFMKVWCVCDCCMVCVCVLCVCGCMLCGVHLCMLVWCVLCVLACVRNKSIYMFVLSPYISHPFPYPLLTSLTLPPSLPSLHLSPSLPLFPPYISHPLSPPYISHPPSLSSLLTSPTPSPIPSSHLSPSLPLFPPYISHTFPYPLLTSLTLPPSLPSLHLSSLPPSLPPSPLTIQGIELCREGCLRIHKRMRDLLVQQQVMATPHT